MRTTLIFLLCLNLLAVLHGATLNVPSQYGTINGALDKAQPGDTILLAAGTYAETVKTVRNGTAGNPITIDGQNVATVQTILISHEYTTLKNTTYSQTVTAPVAYCIWVRRGGNHTRIENCVIDPKLTNKVRGVYFELPSVGPFGTDAPSDCVVTGCTIRNIYNTCYVLLMGDRNLIENNTLTDGLYADFFRVNGRDNIIRGNTCTHITTQGGTGDNHVDCYQVLGKNGIGSWGNIIERNIFHDLNIGQVAQLEGHLLPECGNLTVRNNLFSNTTHAGGCSIPGVKYYNNVFYKVNTLQGGHALTFGQRSYTTTQSYNGTAGTNSADGAEVKNNVFIDCGDVTDNTKGWYSFDTALTGVAADYNLIFHGGTGVRPNTLLQQIGDAGGWDNFKWYEPHGINGSNPLFLDIANGDARFGTGSPLKDAGVTLADVPNDYAGTTRPLGAAYDIGMYESGGTAPTGSAPVVAITAPSNGASFAAGSTQTFTATATDAEDGNIAANVVWSSSLSGSLGTGASLSRGLSPAGTHTITATATDSDGRVGTSTITVTVTSAPANVAPVLTLVSPTANSVTNAFYVDFVRLSATATDDVDGTISSNIIWSSSIEGVFAVGANVDRDKFSVGAHTITATITDSGGLSASASFTLNISQGSVYFGGLVPLEWDANSGSENIIGYRVYERAGTGPYAYTLLGQSNTTQIDVRLPNGDHDLVVTAVNGVGESDYSTALSITVIVRAHFKGPRKHGFPWF
jgi:hypothetical protein